MLDILLKTHEPLSHSAIIPANRQERLLCERKHDPGLMPASMPGWGPSNIAVF